MSKLKCKIVLETWYQERLKNTEYETLNEDFESIEEALAFLSENHEKILNDYPVTGLSINYL